MSIRDDLKELVNSNRPGCGKSKFTITTKANVDTHDRDRRDFSTVPENIKYDPEDPLEASLQPLIFPHLISGDNDLPIAAE